MNKKHIFLAIVALMCLSACGGTEPDSSVTPTSSSSSESSSQQSEQASAAITVAGEHCTITTEKDKNSYKIGDVVRFKVAPVDETYELLEVKVNGADATKGTGEFPYSFTALASNTINAKCELKDAEIHEHFTHCKVEYDNDDGDPYKVGDEVKFTVEEEYGYKVSEVTLDTVELEADDGVYTFVAALEQDLVVVATAMDVTLTEVLKEATIEFEKESYKFGEIVNFNVTYDDDSMYEVASVELDRKELEADPTAQYAYSFEITDLEMTITVNDQKKRIDVDKLHITENDSTVSFGAATYVEVGELAEFTVTPDTYYKVTKVEANGVTLTPDQGVYSFEVALKDNAIVVTTDYDPVAPTIIVAGDVVSFNTLDTNAGSMTLPVVTATSCYGEDLTDSIVRTYKFNGDTTTDPGYNDEEPWAEGDYAIGTHEWTFTVADTHDISKTAAKTVTLNVFKKIFSEGTGGSYKFGILNEVSSNPVVYMNCAQDQSGQEPRTFNMPASQQYYAEVVFSKPLQAGGCGLIHSMPYTGDGFIKEYLQSNNLTTVDIHKSYNWNNGNNTHLIWNNAFNKFNNRLDLSGTFNIDSWLTDGAKLAIARDGNHFYYYVNDQLVEDYVTDQFNGTDTVPGIFANNWKVGVEGNTASDFVLLSGSAAINKIAALADSACPFGYIRNDGNNYTLSSYANGKLTFVAKAGQEKHHEIVTDRTLMKGSNHISFRYECDQYNSGSDDYNLFWFSQINEKFAADPNNKLCKIVAFSMGHYNSYNTTVKCCIDQQEHPWSYTTMFSGDGTNFHWDVAVYDVDIDIILTDTTYTVQFAMTEVAYHGGTLVEEPKTYTSSVLTSGCTAVASGLGSEWYCLSFACHNPATYSISNLVITPILPK